MRITRLELRNVRGFRDARIDFAKVAVIIGKNGTNKTTMLRAIAIALADESSARVMLSQPGGGYVGDAGDHAEISVQVEHNGELHSVHKILRQEGRQELLADGFNQPLQSASVFAYGAGRGSVGGDSSRQLGTDSYSHTASLFDYSRELEDPELTLRRLQDYKNERQYKSLMSGLRKLLELGPKDEIRVARRGGIVLQGPSVRGIVPLTAWADGHRVILSWLLDLFGKAMRSDALDAAGNVTGLLLVDELEQHLHPSLQARVLSHLQKLLPEMQIVVTTHSPLVALAVEPERLVVLRRSSRGIVRADQRAPNYRGYSAEDMLVDEALFDSPVMAPEEERKARTYQRLMAIGPYDRTPQQEKQLRRLARTLLAHPPSPPVSSALADDIAAILNRLDDH